MAMQFESHGQVMRVVIFIVLLLACSAMKLKKSPTKKSGGNKTAKGKTRGLGAESEAAVYERLK